jgi:hypothetical protein
MGCCHSSSDAANAESAQRKMFYATVKLAWIIKADMLESKEEEMSKATEGLIEKRLR